MASGQTRRRGTPDPTSPVDGPEVVRAASTGFTILVIGGFGAPLLPALIPFLAPVQILILPLVSVLAYSVAGWRIGDATNPPLHGVTAAMGAWLLVAPLRVLIEVINLSGPAQGDSNLPQILLDAVIAVLVGACAGHLAGRARARENAGRQR